MKYYVIQAKGHSFYWSGKDWNGPAKKYKSRKIAENAVMRTVSSMAFDKYNKEVVEIIPTLDL
jgi:hypothetical protein